MKLRAHFVLALVLAGCLPARAKILNFDKTIFGTDKMVYVQPPPGKTWRISQGMSYLAAPVPNAWLSIWLEDAPFQPYRNSDGEMIGCSRCLPLFKGSTENQTYFPIVGMSMPITISYPNRLMIAVSPEHGGFLMPFMLFTRLQVEEN